ARDRPPPVASLGSGGRGVLPRGHAHRAAGRWLRRPPALTALPQGDRGARTARPRGLRRSGTRPRAQAPGQPRAALGGPRLLRRLPLAPGDDHEAARRGRAQLARALRAGPGGHARRRRGELVRAGALCAAARPPAVAAPAARGRAPADRARAGAVTSVVIPNWNGARWLPGCLDSLAAES